MQIFKYVKRITYQTDTDLRRCSLYFLLKSLVDSIILKFRGISFLILNPWYISKETQSEVLK